jgi:hypothetical protein
MDCRVKPGNDEKKGARSRGAFLLHPSFARA